MSFEQPTLESVPEEPIPKQEQQEQIEVEANQLARGAKLMTDALFRAKIEGSENLKEISPETQIIFLPTHLSDYDVPIAVGKLGEQFDDISVADASTHKSLFKNPGAYIGRKLGGDDENFFAVDYTGGRGDGNGIFNPENFETMRESLESGRPMVIAAYYDTDYNNHTWQLPDKGGTGGVYLSQITEKETVLVPVAIDIQSEKPFGMGAMDIGQIIKEKRPETRVTIGKPITPKKIEGIENFAKILEKRKNKERLTSEERKEFSRLHGELKNQSDEVMMNLAEMLPREKRGKWDKKNSQ